MKKLRVTVTEADGTERVVDEVTSAEATTDLGCDLWLAHSGGPEALGGQEQYTEGNWRKVVIEVQE